MLAGAKPSISGQGQGPSLRPKGPRAGVGGFLERGAASPPPAMGSGERCKPVA